MLPVIFLIAGHCAGVTWPLGQNCKPSASSAPSPRSLVALPPMPSRIASASSATAMRISSPTPRVVQCLGWRCPLGTCSSPATEAISMIASLPFFEPRSLRALSGMRSRLTQPSGESTSSPSGPLTLWCSI